MRAVTHDPVDRGGGGAPPGRADVLPVRSRGLPARRVPRAARLRLTARVFVALHVLVGAAAGLLVLHPVSMAVFWLEFHPGARGVAEVWRFLLERAVVGLTPRMLAMSGVFAVVGGLLGLAFGLLASTLARRRRTVDRLERELRREITSLLAQGEGEGVEFKASVRWDYRERRVNRALEAVIARTIAGFMNQSGGSVLIGVDDDGSVRGLAADYATLKRPDRDGFQQLLVGLVESHLGGDLCPLVHVLFHQVGGEEICRLVVEPSPRPVYVDEHGAPRYVLRMGNSSRELDVREAAAHIAAHWHA